MNFNQNENNEENSEDIYTDMPPLKKYRYSQSIVAGRPTRKSYSLVSTQTVQNSWMKDRFEYFDDSNNVLNTDDVVVTNTTPVFFDVEIGDNL